MCDPVSLTIAATAASTLGTVVGGVAQAKSLRYSAKVGRQNAAIDRAASRDAMQRGQIETQRQYRLNAQRMGEQRAALAASGVEVDYGSAADLAVDTRRAGWEDAQTVRENAMRESRGYEIRAWNSEAQARADRSAATATMWKTGIDAISTVLGGAQQVRKLQAA